MAIERTLSIIKPDAVKKGVIGACYAKFEEAGLRIVATRMMRLSKAQAQAFYAEHAGRGFYGELVEFMTSGPVAVQVLEGENAIAENRRIMGDTDPANAAEGTLRKLYGANKGSNACHGSDKDTSAAREIAFFFGAADIVSLG